MDNFDIHLPNLVMKCVLNGALFFFPIMTAAKMHNMRKNAIIYLIYFNYSSIYDVAKTAKIMLLYFFM